MLGQRIASAGIGLILLIIVLLSDKIVMNIGIAVISIIALYELFSTVEEMKNSPITFLGYISAVVIAFNTYIPKVWLEILPYIYILLLFVCMLIYYDKIHFNKIAVTFFASAYICYFLSHVASIRELPNGYFLVWLVFLGAWSTDTFAYFIGINFGKHKLIPTISPKKTIEGALGGVIGCGLSFMFFGYIIHVIGNYNVYYINLLVLGLICSIVSQIGDLAASSIKRTYGVKDFGSIMPGHGGILDRFDSVIFVAPVIYYFLVNFNVIQ